MPIIYDEEKVQAIDNDSKTSLTHFDQQREYGYYLLAHDNQMFMVSLTFSSAPLRVPTEEGRQHTFHIMGFSHVDPRDITRVFDEDLGRWVNRHCGRYLQADYKPYKDVIIAHLRVLESYGCSLSEWPHEIIIDFSRLDESLNRIQNDYNFKQGFKRVI